MSTLSTAALPVSSSVPATLSTNGSTTSASTGSTTSVATGSVASASTDSATSATTGSTNQLGQADFLKLMTEQLSQQDPFDPQDNGEFIAQMAQFSTLEGMQTLTNSFAVLAQTLSQGQSLQAASLVGRDVLVPTEFGQLSQGGTINGAVDVVDSSAQSVSVDVVDASGATVDQISIQNPTSGLNNFTWDGQLSDGNPAPVGVYQFKATATGGSQTQAAPVYLEAKVDSVAVDNNGRLKLDVVGLGSIDFEDIRRIN